MKKLLLSLALVFTIALMGQAQTSTYDASVRKMIEVSGGMDMFKTMVPQMISMMKPQLPSVPEAYWNELEKEFNQPQAFNELINKLTPIYKKYLTQADIEGIIKFYETPVGKKMAATAPKISMESMQIGQQWGMQIAQKIQDKLKEKGYLN